MENIDYFYLASCAYLSEGVTKEEWFDFAKQDKIIIWEPLEHMELDELFNVIESHATHIKEIFTKNY